MELVVGERDTSDAQLACEGCTERHYGSNLEGFEGASLRNYCSKSTVILNEKG